MKLRLGIAALTISFALCAVAVVSMEWAILATLFALIFAVTGLGLVLEATDPRRKPNLRTVYGFEVIEDNRMPPGRIAAHRTNPRRVDG